MKCDATVWVGAVSAIACQVYLYVMFRGAFSGISMNDCSNDIYTTPSYS